MPDNDIIRNAIIDMARERGVDKTICPSEVAKQLFSTHWRAYMQEVRDAAVVLHNAGKVVITQKGRAINTDHIKGPIRIRVIR